MVSDRSQVRGFDYRSKWFRWLAAVALLAIVQAAGAAGAAEAPPIYAVEFSHDGKHFAVAIGRRDTLGGLLVYNTQTREPVHAILLEGGAGCLAFSNDDKLLAVGRWKDEALVVDVVSGEVRHRLTHPKAVTGVVLAADGRLLTSCSDRQVRFWDLNSKKAAKTLDAKHGQLHGLSLSPAGALLATAGGDRTAKVWEVASGKLRWTSPQAGSIVRSCRFSPDGKYLLTTDWGGRAHVLETDSFSSVMVIRSGGMDCARLSTDLAWLAIAGMGQNIPLFSVDLQPPSKSLTADIAETIGKFRSDDYTVRKVASKRLEAVGLPAANQLSSHQTDKDAEVRLRCRLAYEKIRNPEPAARLSGHEGDTECVAFSPDNHWIVTGSRGSTLRIWDLASFAADRTRDIPVVTLDIPVSKFASPKKTSSEK